MNKGIRILMLLTAMSLSCNLLTEAPAFVEVSGPTLGVLTATSLDEHGQIVDQRYSFLPTAAQMTVVIQVGQLTSSTPLSVVWYRVSDTGDEKLFEHTIQVDAFDRAYSVGLNPGLLASGTYKAVVSLGDQTQTVTWVVAEEQLGPSAEISQSSNAAQAQPGQTPSSGPSGKVPASQGAASPPPTIPGCPLIATADAEPPNVSVTGHAFAGCTSLGGSAIEVMVSIGDNPAKRGCSFSITSAGLMCKAVGDPCALPGGSDLPGTVLSVSLRQQTTGQVLAQDTLQFATLTFGADKAPPEVQLVSDPSNGVKVKAGQVIKLTGIATENRASGWQTGVSKIEIYVMQPSYEEVGSVTYDSYKDKSCGQKSWTQTTKEFKYTVPEGVTGDLRICAFAYDFAGNIGKDCVMFPTGDKLVGKFNYTIIYKHLGNQGDLVVYTTHTDANLSLTVQADGTVTGTADGTFSEVMDGTTLCGSANGGYMGPYSRTYNPNPVNFKAKVTGHVTPTGIEFRMTSDALLAVAVTEAACGDTNHSVEDMNGIALGQSWPTKSDGTAYTYQGQLAAPNGGTQSWTIRLEPPK